MSDLKRVVELSELLVRQQSRVDALKEELAAANADLVRTQQEDLPTLMLELGLTEIKLDDGRKVTVTEDCSCSITEKTRAAAMRWLRANKFDGIIKTQVTTAFGKGEAERAEKLTAQLREEGYDADCKDTVHPQTLKSFVKERMKASQPLPMDLFNVHPYHKATIKR
jgi:hypothetical protein